MATNGNSCLWVHDRRLKETASILQVLSPVRSSNRWVVSHVIITRPSCYFVLLIQLPFESLKLLDEASVGVDLNLIKGYDSSLSPHRIKCFIVAHVVVLHQVGQNEGDGSGDASHTMDQNIGLTEWLVDEGNSFLEIWGEIKTLVV